MRAFHGDQAIKEKYLARVRAHRAADELVRGVGFESISNGKVRGCAVGCTFDCYDHSLGPIEIGVPEMLIYLEDGIFENLPDGEWQGWPERFLAAIPAGADLSLVHHRFLWWLLTDSMLLTITDANRAAIAAVAELHRRASEGGSICDEEWSEAWPAEWSAMWPAAWSAEWLAARAAARAAQGAAAWQKMADKLIELLTRTG